MRSHGILAASVSLSLMTAAPARGQEFITDLFARATDVSAFAQTSIIAGNSGVRARDNDSRRLMGYGFEVLFELGNARGSRWLAELALGYSYLSGFGSTNPDVDLRGTMRTLPELSVYMTYERTGVEPYFGIHSGLIDLWHTQAYDQAGAPFKIDGQSFQAGVTSGLVWRGAWVEASYRVRKFNSLDWELPETTDVLPAGFPREIDLSGWNFRAGFQFSIKKPEPDKPDEEGSP